MKLIALLMVAVLSGCAHAPWKDNYAINGEIPVSYIQDKQLCHDKAWSAAKEEARTALSGVFPYLFGKYLDACMRAKGYDRVAEPSRIYNLPSNQNIQMGRE